MARKVGPVPVPVWWDHEDNVISDSPNESELRKLRQRVSKFQATIKKLTVEKDAWRHVFFEYGSHLGQCMFVQILEGGRIPNRQDCDCGMHELKKKAIEK